MTHNMPKYMRDKSIPHNFFYSTFSRVNNNIKLEKPQIKTPFIYDEYEVVQMQHTDTRICGFGIFWSGIILLSLLLSCFIRYKNSDKKQIALLLFFILSSSIIFNPENWWARYVPQFWSIPLFITAFLLARKTTEYTKTILPLLLLILMFLNSYSANIEVINNLITQKNMKSQMFNGIKNNTEIVNLYVENQSSYCLSIIEKLKEHNIKYKFIKEEEFKENSIKYERIPVATDVFYEKSFITLGE